MKCRLCILICGALALGSAVEAEQISAEAISVDLRWAADGPGGVPDFIRHVQPLLGKMGCNGRACHGSFQGQGGFRLSLFGSDPLADHNALLDGLAGPRVAVDKAESSLALLKATAQVGHEGGKRFEVGSWQYSLLRSWIAAGAAYEAGNEPVFERLEVLPPKFILHRSGSTSEVRTVAHYTDGRKEDVTALTQFSTNDDAVANTTDGGLVTAAGPGDTAIVATFGGAVSTAQVLVPVSETNIRSFVFEHHNKIDELVATKWRELGYEPSELSADGQFLRRVSLDLIGTLPTADEVQEFLVDTDPQKRVKKIDELLQRPEYAQYWATKFSDWTGNDTGLTPPPAAKTSWLWHGWLRQKLADNLPYDEMVAGFITATTREGRSVGDTVTEYKQIAADIMPNSSKIKEALTSDWNGEDGFESTAYERRKSNDLFWHAYTDPEQASLRISYAFLGIRLECAQCHKHPYDRWTIDDFRGFTAFFSDVRRDVPGDVPNDVVFAPGTDERTRDLVYRYNEILIGDLRENVTKSKGAVDQNAKARKVLPRVLGGRDMELSKNFDRRIDLMDWLRDRDNPYFSKALVNRLWAHYFGLGLCEPTDELSAANAPSNPELLDWLAADFVDHQFDLKHLHRTILNSRVYQLTWRPNASNAFDQRNYSHARLRRLPAEVLLDAIDQVTGSREVAYTWQAKTYNAIIAPEGTRAIGLAPTRLGQSRASYALEVFGRPMRSERCDAERSQDVTLSQALYLLYDEDINRKIADPDGRLVRLVASSADDHSVLNQLYLTAVSRLPTPEETKEALDYVDGADSRMAGFEDILWSLINLREFAFNH